MFDKLLLASASPRRMDLLTECKIPFDSVNHEFDEDSADEKNPVRLSEILASGKAHSIAGKAVYHDKLVLGVDTIVAHNNEVLGKPENAAEAERFIRLLSGKTHRVISGISLVNRSNSINITRHSVSRVSFIKFNEKFIKYYLDNNLWPGYAGGYAIQGIFGMFAGKIKGSYSNIVGLPVDVLYKMLKDINFKFVW